MSGTPHRGVAEDDPRNRGAIDFFRPPQIDEDYVRGRLAAVYRRESVTEIAERARRFMADVATRPPRPPPPLSQPIEAAPDPWFGLGVRPDIIEQLWRLDSALPRPSRWLVWGHPALVHPEAGVIFAVAIGTIGIAARLPPALADATPRTRMRRPMAPYDLSPAGPEWRLLAPRPLSAHALAAYAFAAA